MTKTKAWTACLMLLCPLLLNGPPAWAAEGLLRAMKYTPRSAEESAKWQASLRASLFEALHLSDLLLLKAKGQLPFNTTVLREEKKGNCLMREVEFNSTPTRRMRALLALPLDGTVKRPAVVCIAGHGGNRFSVYDRDSIYKGFAAELADKGAVAISADVAQHEVYEPGRTLMGERLWDLMRCVDLLVSLKEVDPQRIGCAGLSLGGEMAMWLGGMDERIAATASCGFLTSMDQMEKNHCMCWKFDGLREVADWADIYSLIAPRPLLCENGLKETDDQFPVPLAREVFSEIQIIYKSYGEEGKAEFVAHEGGHEIDLPALMRFFSQYLKTGG